MRIVSGTFSVSHRPVGQVIFARRLARTYAVSGKSPMHSSSLVKDSKFPDSGRESRPGEFHPEALAEPDRTLSRHPAPIMEPRYVPTPSGQTALDNDARCSRSSA